MWAYVKRRRKKKSHITHTHPIDIRVFKQVCTQIAAYTTHTTAALLNDVAVSIRPNIVAQGS